MKLITITIDEKGDADVDLTGFHGKGCHAIQEGFEKALGKGVSGFTKPEYNRPCDTKTKITQGQ